MPGFQSAFHRVCCSLYKRSQSKLAALLYSSSLCGACLNTSGLLTAGNRSESSSLIDSKVNKQGVFVCVSSFWVSGHPSNKLLKECQCVEKTRAGEHR